MPAYAYAITIDYKRSYKNIDVRYDVEENHLTLDMLKPLVGGDRFTVQSGEWGDYIITVHTKVLEPDAEYNKRIAKAEAYMVEYNKRKNKTV